MKTQPDYRETGTFEDMVFEGRNKSYGAFDLNRKRSRYMLVAFLISIAGITTCIAVPFINAFKEGPSDLIKEISQTVKVTLINTKKEVPPPPRQPVIESPEKLFRNLKPIVVDRADEELPLLTPDELIDKTFNKPILDEFPVQTYDPVIPEPEIDTIILFPSEPAGFMGGDLNKFRKWVGDNMKYPSEAELENIFGKVTIEFCVNKKGEVVEIKVLRGLHPVLDEATIKVISSSPKWTPAKQGGNPVKTKYIIPFMFDLI